MSDRDALLATIRSHPDELTPRLIYADWLDERGDPESTQRAEFIRLQCGMKTAPLFDLPDMERRCKQLLNIRQKKDGPTNRQRWVQDSYPALGAALAKDDFYTDFQFDGGFPTHLLVNEMNHEAVLQHAPALFASDSPLEQLEIEHVSGFLATLFARLDEVADQAKKSGNPVPQWRKLAAVQLNTHLPVDTEDYVITGIYQDNLTANVADLDTLRERPELRELRRLRIGVGMAEPGFQYALQQLIELGDFSRLETLSLLTEGNQSGDYNFIANAAGLPQLKNVEIYPSFMGHGYDEDQSTTSILQSVQSDVFKKLERLSIAKIIHIHREYAEQEFVAYLDHLHSLKQVSLSSETLRDLSGEVLQRLFAKIPEIHIDVSLVNFTEDRSGGTRWSSKDIARIIADKLRKAGDLSHLQELKITGVRFSPEEIATLDRLLPEHTLLNVEPPREVEKPSPETEVMEMLHQRVKNRTPTAY